jgi:beta-N-acetylhexosaminidase
VSELARLAGSVIVTGLPADSGSLETLAAVRALGPGGVVLFERNVTSVAGTRQLVEAVREAIGGAAPALVCVDQEGGRVARLRFREPGIPAAMALGAANDEALAERAGAALASDLSAIGANLNFAPVLDLALAARSTVIGTRSLGDDPRRAARLGAALIRGLQGHGVAATAKHFPGHGATALDSHRELPVVRASAEVLRARELVPFAAAIAAGVRAVMTAHVLVPSLDPERPASLSRSITTDLLRGELGFEGVCFTDCLQMDALASGVGSLRGGVLALAAGADALLVSHDIELALGLRDALVAAVAAHEIPLGRLEEAAFRVAELRAALGREKPPKGASEHEPAPAGDGTARAVASRAIALVRGQVKIDRLRPVTVISFEGDASDGVARVRAERPSLSLALRRRRVRSEQMRVALEPEGDTLALLVDVLGSQHERAFVVVARRAHLHPQQVRAIDTLLEFAPDAIVVSALEPYDVPLLDRASVLLCTFGDEEANVEALADVLVGDARAPGGLPVKLSSGAARRVLTEAEIDAKLPPRDAGRVRAGDAPGDDAEAGGA